jgi:hypothetical protein
VRFFASIPKEERERADDPVKRHAAVTQAIPGMRDTCFSYSERNRELIALADPLTLRDQDMPEREI